MEAKDAVTPRSSLHDDLGMDEVDLIEVMFRAEERFGLVLPDNGIGLSGLAPVSWTGEVLGSGYLV